MVSIHIQTLRSWVSRVLRLSKIWGPRFPGSHCDQNFEVLGFQGLRHITILRSWVSRVPRQKGRARSKIHQGPRPWTQRTQDLGSFWDLGTSLATPIKATSPLRQNRLAMLPHTQQLQGVRQTAGGFTTLSNAFPFVDQYTVCR